MRLRIDSRVGPIISRRETLTALLGGWLAASLGCDSSTIDATKGSSSGEGQAIDSREGRLPVRTEPLPVPLVPLAQLPVSSDELAELQPASVPPDLKKYPPVLIYHAIRLWGRQCRFEGHDFARTDLKDRFGERMFESLVNDDAFRSVSASNFRHLLVPSEFGVRVRATTDPGFGSEFASTHPGKYVQIMAELGVSSETPLDVVGGVPATLVDVINDEARRVDLLDELEWNVNGLSRYLTVQAWINRFNVRVSFDEMAATLVSKPLGAGACNGIHVLYGLAVLLAIQRQMQLLSPSVERSVRRKLRKCSDLLNELQLPSGGWSLSWSKSHGARSSIWKNEILDFISVTGHHLEWMSICESDLRPSETTIAHAARSLSLAMRTHWRLVQSDWHYYPPWTHAVKGLLGLGEQRWAQWTSTA